jgi:hypothetical protein
MPRPHPPRFRAAGLLALSLALWCCGGPPAPRWPDGASLVARRDALDRLLERLAGLRDTPLARRALALRAALPACPILEARAASGRLADALAELACAPSGDAGPLGRVHELRGERDLAFALPLAGGGHAIGSAALAASGDLELDVSLPAGALRGASRLLLPGGTPPGPGVLSSDGTLVHARLRPEGGLDLASLVDEREQAARLFRLKSDLFSGAVLDGTWELAIYAPAEGRAMPDAALAVGFALKAPAVAVMEEFLGEIRETWPVRRSPFEVGAAGGACLLDLALLPELAPCYVADERALVVGWNPASLRRALAPGPRRTEGGAVVDLERIADVDARLAAAAAESPRALAAAPALAWPWRRLHASGERRDDGLHLRVVLEGARA